MFSLPPCKVSTLKVPVPKSMENDFSGRHDFFTYPTNVIHGANKNAKVYPVFKQFEKQCL